MVRKLGRGWKLNVGEKILTLNDGRTIMQMIGKTTHTGPGWQNCHCCGISKKTPQATNTQSQAR